MPTQALFIVCLAEESDGMERKMLCLIVSSASPSWCALISRANFVSSSISVGIFKTKMPANR